MILSIIAYRNYLNKFLYAKSFVSGNMRAFLLRFLGFIQQLAKSSKEHGFDVISKDVEIARIHESLL